MFKQPVRANSIDPDRTAPKEQSDQGLYCLQQSFAKLLTLNPAVKPVNYILLFQF